MLYLPPTYTTFTSIIWQVPLSRLTYIRLIYTTEQLRAKRLIGSWSLLRLELTTFWSIVWCVNHLLLPYTDTLNMHYTYTISLSNTKPTFTWHYIHYTCITPTLHTYIIALEVSLLYLHANKVNTKLMVKQTEIQFKLQRCVLWFIPLRKRHKWL